MKKEEVITAFVTRNKKVLLLKRSQKVGTFPGAWAGVSGYVETDIPLEQAWIELFEELGIQRHDAVLEVTGSPLQVPSKETHCTWVVHPFRFSLTEGKELRLDWEHVEMNWTVPEEIRRLQTVPGLWEAWCRVRDGF
jgi:8-oxo-dGTP pyrophosphatase MutT (NUDIX family)